MQAQKKWHILYRGPLSSCNYSCHYCPFAKTKNTRAELAEDARQLERFSNWISGRKEQIGILFTPWGEGLIRKHYQQAMTQLSHLPQVYKVAIQTNLSCPTAWMQEVARDSFALWTTYHPTQLSIDAFLAKTEELNQMGIRYSVGMVGLKEDFELIAEMRQRLSPQTYFWVNAYKREENYYSEADYAFLNGIDPFFHYNNIRHPSLGKSCQAGLTSFSVDGDGNMYSCHFIKAKIGNIYEDVEAALRPRTCVNETCGCHIGYIHMDELKLYEHYGDGLMERIPLEF
jgi:MoaA/NifB/PqqE/SkfB family radical SAM enzyme